MRRLWRKPGGRKKRSGKERRGRKRGKKRGGKRAKRKKSGEGDEIPEGGGEGPERGQQGEREGTELSVGGLILGEEEEEEEEGEELQEEENDSEGCAICLDPMDDDDEEEEDDVVCRLQCSHEFHGSCVESWTSTCTRKGLPLTCPTWRRPLVRG